MPQAGLVVHHPAVAGDVLGVGVLRLGRRIKLRRRDEGHRRAGGTQDLAVGCEVVVGAGLVDDLPGRVGDALDSRRGHEQRRGGGGAMLADEGDGFRLDAIGLPEVIHVAPRRWQGLC
jgi:hypothetical protein